jgi:quinoprotein glucose dehydrogenase
MLPSNTGGANWQGGSLDPETKILYVFSNNNPSAHGLVPPDVKRSDMRYVQGRAPDPNAPPAGAGRGGAVGGGAAAGAGAAPGPGRGGGGGGAGPLTVQGLPLIKPPYGRITAIDLNKGDIVWQIAHGDTPDTIRNHPALKGVTIPRTGRTGRIGTLVTKTLLVAGEGSFNTLATGQRGALLRAYDKTTGADIGAVPMPAPQTGSPMTYMVNGKQYIAVAISGTGYPGELLVFRVPDATATK